MLDGSTITHSIGSDFTKPSRMTYSASAYWERRRPRRRVQAGRKTPASSHPVVLAPLAVPVYGRRVGEVTHILDRVGQGDPKAAEELLPVVYEELRKLAAARLAHEQPGQTLQATALVHEAWLRLAAGSNQQWNSKGHFLMAAAEAMRRILIDRARRRLAAKRGSGATPLDLDEVEIPAPTANDDQLLAVNEALERFAALDPRKAELVKLRYFVGLTFEEAAAALAIAVPTAKQWWTYARAWLTVELKGTHSG